MRADWACTVTQTIEVLARRLACRCAERRAAMGEAPLRNFTINFGPQHPAAHGVLRLVLELTKLDKYQLLILDDIAYVTKDQAETSVLFELIAARYEHRSLLITANHPFGEWGKIFSDQAMTLAAIDRLVHHATILEMNVESYRRKAALKRKRGPGD